MICRASLPLKQPWGGVGCGIQKAKAKAQAPAQVLVVPTMPLGAIPTMLLGAMLAPAMPHGVMMAPTMPLGAMLALTMPLGPMMAPTMPLGTAAAVPEMVVGRQTIVVVPDMVLEVVSHSQVQEIGMVGPQTRALVMAVAAIATGTTVIQGSMGNGLPVIGPMMAHTMMVMDLTPGPGQQGVTNDLAPKKGRPGSHGLMWPLLLRPWSTPSRARIRISSSRIRPKKKKVGGNGTLRAADDDEVQLQMAMVAMGRQLQMVAVAQLLWQQMVAVAQLLWQQMVDLLWQQMVLDLELLWQEMVVQWQMVALVLLDQRLHLQAMWQQMSPVRLVVSLFGIWIARSV